MELETLFGLPAHPLMVHLPVVLIPLAGVIAVVLAFKPAWLDKVGWWLVGVTGLGMIGAIMAAGSGEGLEELQREGETAAREDHFEMGELARTLSIVFFVVVLAVVALRWYAKRKGGDGGEGGGAWGFARSKIGAIVAAVVLVVSAGAATWTMAAAGHQGAKLAWCEETQNCSTGGGEGDEEGEYEEENEGG